MDSGVYQNNTKSWLHKYLQVKRRVEAHVAHINSTTAAAIPATTPAANSDEPWIIAADGDFENNIIFPFSDPNLLKFEDIVACFDDGKPLFYVNAVIEKKSKHFKALEKKMSIDVEALSKINAAQAEAITELAELSGEKDNIIESLENQLDKLRNVLNSAVDIAGVAKAK